MAPEPLTEEEWAQLEARRQVEELTEEAHRRTMAILGRYRRINPPGLNRAQRRMARKR